ncbi:hypothetical protein J4E08_22140, partial [Sagittula sp. NFXS13]|uniref:TipJ family phage tail tip protein n=1 Tax=Sagittula sp. NFXS13 TaxID=2819095 RepID=UPI0032E01C96
MTFHKPIHGAGGGKGGGHTPDESPDSLFSDSVALLIDVVSEGEIEGWADPELPGTCIFFDDTPLQNADGSLNFEGVSYTLRTGTPDQAPVKGVEASSSEIGVNAQVKQAEPVVRSVASADVDAVVVKAHVPSLVNRQDDGDLRPTGVEFAIDIKAGDGPWDVAKEATISGKTLSGYVRAYRINLPSVRPVAIRMRRITADSADTSRANDLYFASFTEVIDAHLSYPDTAYVALAVRADAFGGRVPRRSYRLRGLKCLVPSNYDPETRTYDESAIWDGTFKRAFTSNPAFFSYSVYIDDRWGLGDRIDPTLVDKWRIYSIGKYCDELVDNGFGGQEPRFEINGVIDTRAAAYEVITNLSATFRGVTYWGAGAIVPVQDAPADPVKLVTNANVVDGSFSYSGTGLAARKTAAVASFRDVQDHYRIKPAAVHEDIAGIYRFGRRQVELALPFETRRGAAFRACRWEVETNLNATELVSYQAGFDHAAIRPGDRVLISDKNRLLLRAGGRILGVGADRRSVVLDAAIAVDEVEDLRLHVASAIGDFYTVEVDAPTGDAVTQLDLVDPLPADVVPGAVFMLNATGIAPRLFRVMSNTPQGHLFNVTAVLDDPDKFARVEADLSVEDPDPYIIPSRGAPNAPSGLQLSTFLRADVGSKSKMKFNFSWTRPPSDPVASYTVFFEEPGTARRKVADGIRDTSIDIEPEALDAGEYVATVHAVNQTGQSSPAARVVLDFTAPPYIVPDPPDVVGATAGFDTVEIRIAPHPASDFRAFRIYGATADDDTPVLIDETSQAVYARRPQAGDAVTRYKVTAYTFGDLESDIGQSSWIALRPTGVPIDGLQEAVTDAIESARQSATADKAGAEDAAAAALAAAGAAASSENDAAASRDNAAAAAIEAAASRSDAATAAIDAASSRSDAATAAIDAASSRSDAATAAIDAASSRSDAETAAIDAASSRSDAATAAINAASSRDDAATAAIDAAASTVDAVAAAIDAVASKGDASSSADLAGQRASAAEVAQQAAETAQSGAESARGAAVTAKNDAEGAASSASTSEALSSTARRRAEHAVTGNLFTEGSFDDLDHLNQTDISPGAIVNVPAPHPLGRTKALRQTSRDAYWPTAMIEGDIRGRTYRVTGWVYNEDATAQARVGFHIRYAEGGSTWPTVLVADPKQVGWVEFDVEMTISPNYGSCAGWRLFLQQNGSADTHTLLCYWTDLRWEDITNVVASQEAATASADSATTASSQADLAGLRASAAETAQQAAETARSGATSARDAAVTARQGAEDAEATATTQAGLATQAATDAGDA